MHLTPHWGWPRSNFVKISGVRKLESLGNYVALFAWSLCLTVLRQYWRVMNRRTDGQTDGQTHDDSKGNRVQTCRRLYGCKVDVSMIISCRIRQLMGLHDVDAYSSRAGINRHVPNVVVNGTCTSTITSHHHRHHSLSFVPKPADTNGSRDALRHTQSSLYCAQSWTLSVIDKWRYGTFDMCKYIHTYLLISSYTAIACTGFRANA